MPKKFKYVSIGTKVIEVHASETDELFAHLWEYDDVEGLGADTDDLNDFGILTHCFTKGLLIPKEDFFTFDVR